MQSKEKLSAYMDGYLADDNFADEINRNAELKQKWASYHTIRSVMRGEEQLLGADFSAKMEMLLDAEEMEKAPRQRGLMLHLKKWSTPIMQAGIAASVCLVAVLGFNTMNSENELAQNEQPVMLTLPFSTAVQQVSYNAPSQVQPTAERLEYQQRLLNSLLQNHELQRRTNVNGITLNEEQKQQSQTSSNELPKPQNAQ